MINVRAVANRATSEINPNAQASVRVCIGYTIGEGRRRVPEYAEAVTATVQVQALSKKDVEHLDSMNITNADRACYSNMQLTAADRKAQSGGDLVTVLGDTYLVTAILENWTTAGWGKVALTRQTDA